VSAIPPVQPAAPAIESDEEVEQLALPGQTVRLRKQRLRVDGRLAILRKFVRPDGPKVVLVHGFAQNRYTWHSPGRSLSAWLAARGFDVHVLELRGHGNSRAAGGPERFADYVADARVAARSLREPAFWVGHSLGGAAGYAVATETPVRGVIGLGALYRFGQANLALNVLCRLSNLVRGREILGGLSVRTRLAGQLLGRLYGISDIAGYAFPISGWAPGSIEPELLAERLERGFDWTSLHVWLDMARWGAEHDFDYAAAWKRTDVPLLVIAGDLDHLMPPDDARAAYDEAGSTDRRWVLMDDWNTGVHWGHLDLILGREAPRVVWPLLADWMHER
jgi:pimeloyl-ACP methyl ester carboxylesterase